MKKLILVTLKILGATLGIVVVLFVAGVLWPLDVPQANERPTRLLLINVRVVDVESGLIRESQNILLEDGKIVAMGSGLKAENVQVHDGGGRHAIPGLFDMHVHSIKMAPSLTHPLFVAAGVTAVRDMGGCIGIEDAWIACAEEKRVWNSAVNKGTMIGPRYDRITGLAINGGSEIPSALGRSLGAPTAEDARERVVYDKTRGLDFLKPYTRIPREGYFALAEAARDNGMYLAGHQPLAVSADEAISAGQRSIEHAFLFIWECYAGMDKLRDSEDPRSIYTSEMRLRMIEQHDAALCSGLHEQMIEASTASVPTHTTRKLDAYSLDEDYKNDSRLIYVPAPLRALWREDANNMAERAGNEGASSYKAFYEFGIQQTGVAHRAGVTILAGTDAPDSYAFPGTGLHDELDHFIEAGLTPLDTLRAATLEPAAFLGLVNEAGVIKPGARADIVLLNGNPLADIRAVRDIETVVLAGVVYNRSDLDAILNSVEETANSWTMWPKFLWQILRSPIMRKQFGD